ncbi:hypothetical protein [Oceanobacillus saliphilus]|uniref:hypothetical protein n=1 Tax=Oceanobacillus saliphilus TaxID=2925834 RepID=UPI00201DB83D|nr:hypothetical protein [Oceanobacillus saliphilus]
MDEQILDDLLTEMNNEMKSMKLYIHSLKSEMHNRFDTIEEKLEGVGRRFESHHHPDTSPLSASSTTHRKNY